MTVRRKAPHSMLRLSGKRAEVEVQHLAERCGIPTQACAKGRALPAVDEKVRHRFGVRPLLQLAALDRLFQAAANPPGDLGEAPLDLAPEHLAHARQLLTKAAQQTSEISLAAILLFSELEEPAYPIERGQSFVTETTVEPAVGLLHVEIDE